MRSQPSEPAGRGRARRYLTALAAFAGTTLLIWLILRAGPTRLVGELRALGPVFPLIVIVTGVRYLLQAAGWRLAMKVARRPGWLEAIGGVVAGEAVGHLAGGGPIAREPVKAFFVRHRVPVREGLSAALPERVASIGASTTLVVAAGGIFAIRWMHFAWLAMPAAALVLFLASRFHRFPRRSRRMPDVTVAEAAGRDASLPEIQVTERKTSDAMLHVARDLWHDRRAVLLAITGLALGQETINVFEAYVLLTWLGAAPSLATVIAFEGASRAANAAGVLIPGRVGVYEAANSALADVLHLGATYGLAVALARRARSVIWGVVGLGLLALRTAHGRGQAPVLRE